MHCPMCGSWQSESSSVKCCLHSLCPYSYASKQTTGTENTPQALGSALPSMMKGGEVTKMTRASNHHFWKFCVEDPYFSEDSYLFNSKPTIKSLANKSQVGKLLVQWKFTGNERGTTKIFKTCEWITKYKRPQWRIFFKCWNEPCW